MPGLRDVNIEHVGTSHAQHPHAVANLDDVAQLTTSRPTAPSSPKAPGCRAQNYVQNLTTHIKRSTDSHHRQHAVPSQTLLAAFLPVLYAAQHQGTWQCCSQRRSLVWGLSSSQSIISQVDVLCCALLCWLCWGVSQLRQAANPKAAGLSSERISCSKLQTPHLSGIRLFPRRFGKATFEAQDFLKDVVSCDRVLINRTARKSALPQFKEIPAG